MLTTLTIVLCWFRQRRRQLRKVAPLETKSLRPQVSNPKVIDMPDHIPIPRVNQVVRLDSGVAPPLPSRVMVSRHNSSTQIEESTEGPYINDSVNQTPNMSFGSDIYEDIMETVINEQNKGVHCVNPPRINLAKIVTLAVHAEVEQLTPDENYEFPPPPLDSPQNSLPPPPPCTPENHSLPLPSFNTIQPCSPSD